MLAKKTELVLEKKMKDSVRSQKIEQSECAREHMAVATLGYGLTVLNKMIDKTANIANMKWVLEEFCKAFFEVPSVKMRFRPSFSDAIALATPCPNINTARR